MTPPYCKACDSPARSELDRHFSQGESVRAISGWLDEVGLPISRPTLSKHRSHALDPRTAALEVRSPGEKPMIPTIRRVSSTSFLEALVSEGARQVEAHPSRVKIDHALRAASVLERKRDPAHSPLAVLVLALTGHPPAPTIPGTFTELERSQ